MCRKHGIPVVLVLLLALCGLAGCLGEDDPTGTAYFTIAWPANAQSVKIECWAFAGDAPVVINRAEGEERHAFTVPNVRQGIPWFTATLYDTPDAMGKKQAVGYGEVVVDGKVNTPVAFLTTDETGAQLDISPQDIFLNYGNSRTFYAMAITADDAYVLLPPATWKWRSNHPEIVSINEQTGRAKAGYTHGVAILTLTAGQTLSAATSVQVIPVPPTVTLTANNYVLKPSESTTLSWSSSNASEVVSSSGLSSPSLSGSQTVSPSQTTTYTITVSGPGGMASASTTVVVLKAGEEPKTMLRNTQ